MEFKGIQNIGNTCGINSIIQCIKSLNKLPQNADSPFYNNLLNANNDNIRYFIKELSKKSNGLICRGEQNDITEIWMILYDILENELAKPEFLLKYSSDSQFDCAMRKFNPKGGSFWTDTFQGTLLQTMKCQDCSYTCQNYETFTMLSLPLKEDLETALSAFMSPEKNLGWKCDRCSSQNTEKSHKFWRLPNTLSFSLQRFKYSTEFIKRTKPVTIPPEIMFQTPSGVVHYKLKSAALHFGNGVGNGHYTAIIPGPDILIDDDRIFKVNNMEEILENNKEIYLLFYQTA